MLHLGRVHAAHTRSILASALVVLASALVAIVAAGVLPRRIGLTGLTRLASGVHPLHAGITGGVLGSSRTLPLQEGVSRGLLLIRNGGGVSLHAPVARGILSCVTPAGSIPSGSRLVRLGAVV